MLTEKEYKEDLRQEGFKNIEVMTDDPGKIYPDHTHDTMVAHIILEGEMMLVVKGTVYTLRPGDRFDVPREAVHSARVGLSGCRYIVADR